MIARLIFARFIFAFGIVAAASLPAELMAEESRALPDTPQTPVTRQEVWQAVAAELRERGLSEQQLPRDEDLDLPVALPALAGRTLRVSSACWDAVPRRTQFRLECSEPGQCLPFLVYLREYVREYARDHVSADAGARAGRCGPAWWPRPAAGASPKPAVRAGDRVTAVFLANHLRMTASVICLERGRAGEVIRVRSQDGHIFRARISGPAQLEALPQ